MKTPHVRRLPVSLLAAGALALTAAAQEAAPAPSGPLTLTTQRVVVFKDGHALFIKSARGTATETGRVFTTEVPDNAVLGCFWALSESREILAMRAEVVETSAIEESEEPCLTVLELLRANAGRSLTLVRKDDTDVTGVVREVLELPAEEPQEAAPARLDWRASASGRVPVLTRPEETVVELVPRGGNLVVVDGTKTGRSVVPVAEIRALTGPEISTTMTRRRKVTRRTRQLSFELGPETAGKEVSLTLLYFRPGLRWIPTYRVQLASESEAGLALQGEILNEAEDLEGVPVDLVVGVPNFRFQSTISPLSLEPLLRGALQAADPRLFARNDLNAFANFANSQSSGRWSGQPPVEADENVLALAPELATAGQQDLFVYGVSRFSLPRGARATVPLWQSQVPYRHLYTMDVKVQRHGSTGGMTLEGGEDDSPLRLTRNRVWHQLELTNRSEVPWTTGAALLLREQLPLAQELMVYTPVGGASLVPVTVAVDMKGEYREEEVERHPDAIRWAGHTYAEIRKTGSVTLGNFRKEPARVRVSVSLGGKAESATDEGIIRVNDYQKADWADNRWEINSHSDVTWELELAPGETRELGFTFSFFVR